VRAEVLEAVPANIAKVARALQAGEIAAMPTETVYGLAADAFQTAALAKIYEAKERPTFDPLILHLAPGQDLAEIVDWGRVEKRAREQAEKLMAAFWPGPFTLVLPKQARVPDLATSGLPTVGVRMPVHPAAQALIRAVGKPLAAPSANRFGRISPTTAAAVVEELGDRISFILDGGPCQVGVESTIVGYPETGQWRLLRPGGIPVEKIEAELGERLVSPGRDVVAPGMLESHYAPRKPLRLLSGLLGSMEDAEVVRTLQGARPGVLLLGGNPLEAQARLEKLLKKRILVVSLSPSGDLAQAAAALFSSLRLLDRSTCDALYAEPCTSQRGLGYAISDRLKRASTPEQPA
jgi:L-threonylcarbamoyladenylate synthase